MGHRWSGRNQALEGSNDEEADRERHGDVDLSFAGQVGPVHEADDCERYDGHRASA